MKTDDDGRNGQRRSRKEEKRVRTDSMAPLSVALTVHEGAGPGRRQIRLEAELGFHDEGGGVEALIGRVPPNPANAASCPRLRMLFFAAV
jgi:hypothetical protein